MVLSNPIPSVAASDPSALCSDAEGCVSDVDHNEEGPFARPIHPISLGLFMRSMGLIAAPLIA
ncbi:hypothetical protein SynROS8604_00247 [Synechococcus sp. ROS8604]|nr:hypothetical protein SynROS8604_00247 [Synechococcus sp. ROS8604]